MDFLCLQRQSTGDYLLTLAHPEQKRKLLFLGTIYHHNVAYFIDDPDRKVTFCEHPPPPPLELSDVVLQAHLRKYGTTLSARRGKYHSHPEVEDGIRHVLMLLRTNIPTTLHVGPLRVSVKYDGQPHICSKCGEQGHSTVTCRHIQCYGCNEIGHRRAQCDRLTRCLYCGSATHTGNACTEAFPSFNRQAYTSAPKVSPRPRTSLRVLFQKHLVPRLLKSPPKRPRTITKETFQPPITSAEASGSQGGPSLQDLLKGAFGTPVVEQCRLSPRELRLTAPLRERIQVSLKIPSTHHPRSVG